MICAMHRRRRGAALAVALLAAACGSSEGSNEAMVLTRTDQVAAPSEADTTIAGDAVTAFGYDVLGALSAEAPEGNLIVSPLSVVAALALLEPGARGAAQTELRNALHVTDTDAFHASLSALEQRLVALAASPGNEGEKPGELAVRLANAAYLQQGYPFEQAYLDRIGELYGPQLRGVDFTVDPDAVADEINAFIAEVTKDRIKDLVKDGVLTTDTVLALVNALYFKASWLEVFDKSATVDGDFTRRDGSTVNVPLMHGRSFRSARGDGWVAASKAYVGGLWVDFLLPDEGRYDHMAGALDTAFAELDATSAKGAELAVPKFETRRPSDLGPALRALGIRAAFEEGNLRGIADDPRLRLAEALHETYVAMDEEGTEAAAATVLTGEATSGSTIEPVPVILDRPFFFRIVDPTSHATLFVGRILDPTT
jgi:serpin B